MKHSFSFPSFLAIIYFFNPTHFSYLSPSFSHRFYVCLLTLILCMCVCVCVCVCVCEWERDRYIFCLFCNNPVHVRPLSFSSKKKNQLLPLNTYLLCAPPPPPEGEREKLGCPSLFFSLSPSQSLSLSFWNGSHAIYL